MHSCGNNNNTNFKKGFNNGKICFQYPGNWKTIEENIDFLVAAFLDEKHNTAIKVSIAPSAFNSVDEIKEITEKDLELAGWKIKNSEIFDFENKRIWDILCDAIINEQEFESEQLYLIENNDLYCFELDAVKNRNDVINDFRNLIQSFEILEPSYKVEGENITKI